MSQIEDSGRGQTAYRQWSMKLVELCLRVQTLRWYARHLQTELAVNGIHSSLTPRHNVVPQTESLACKARHFGAMHGARYPLKLNARSNSLARRLSPSAVPTLPFSLVLPILERFPGDCLLSSLSRCTLSHALQR
jgi:hypothetical protein